MDKKSEKRDYIALDSVFESEVGETSGIPDQVTDLVSLRSYLGILTYLFSTVLRRSVLFITVPFNRRPDIYTPSFKGISKRDYDLLKIGVYRRGKISGPPTLVHRRSKDLRSLCTVGQ